MTYIFIFYTISTTAIRIYKITIDMQNLKCGTLELLSGSNQVFSSIVHIMASLHHDHLKITKTPVLLLIRNKSKFTLQQFNIERNFELNRHLASELIRDI